MAILAVADGTLRCTIGAGGNLLGSSLETGNIHSATRSLMRASEGTREMEAEVMRRVARPCESWFVGKGVLAILSDDDLISLYIVLEETTVQIRKTSSIRACMRQLR